MGRHGELHKNDGEDGNDSLVYQLLLPLSRSLATNWIDGHRREAGVALSHMTGSGDKAGSYISTLSKMLKKIDPVRLLESHMACLRHSYDSWMFNEPEIESDRPTDEEMAAYEEAEQQHKEQFQALEHQAARLSQSLGVGRLSDPKLSPALLGFIREGIRFSFSNRDMGSDDQDLVLGCRLSFLYILAKYVNWIRRNRAHALTIRSDLDDKEYTLRNHEEFSEIHQDDALALASFRELLGFKPLPESIPITPVTTDGESVMPQSVAESSMPGDSLVDDDSEATPEALSRRSIASSVHTDLSPVEEASSSPSTQHVSLMPKDEDSEELSISSKKISPASSSQHMSLASENLSRAPSSRRSITSQSTYLGKSQNTYAGNISSPESSVPSVKRARRT